jgi:hypothetical protein
MSAVNENFVLQTGLTVGSTIITAATGNVDVAGSINVTSDVVITGNISANNLQNVAFTGKYSDLKDVPTGFTQVQTDWNSSSGIGAILNKPSINNKQMFANVAFTGVYDDLLNTYALPTASNVVLGGVKQGENVTISNDGTISVIAGGVTSFATRTGDIALTIEDINSTLGFNGKTVGINDIVANVALLTPIAFTGSYYDLADLPIITPSLPISNLGSTGEYADIVNPPSLLNKYNFASVAFTGNYSDVNNTPALSRLASTGEYIDLKRAPVLANVATTGSYLNLIDTPKLVPIATSGAYTDLKGAPILVPLATSGAYTDLKGAPILADVATTGSYLNLKDVPTYFLTNTSNINDLGLGVSTALTNSVTGTGNIVLSTSPIITGTLTTSTIYSTGLITANAGISVPSGQIITVADTPTTSTSVANKGYVDSVAVGLTWKDSVIAATNSDIILSGEQTVDTVSVITGNRILVKNQTDATHNGIYVASTGAWVRALDMNDTTPIQLVNNSGVFVTNGLQINTGWTVTSYITSIDTSLVIWTQFSGATVVVAGTGLTLVGNQININPSQPEITDIGNLTNLTVTGLIYGNIVGTGIGLTNLNGANITSNTVPLSALAISSGTATSSSFLRGDGTWAPADTNLTGPITSIGNATSIGEQTGLGNVFVMQTSPTINGTLSTGIILTTGDITTVSGQFVGSGVGLTSIPNSSLVNSSITVNGIAISLGESQVVTAAAGTLTGSTLNASVVNSSLTNVGTLTNLTVTNTINGNITGSSTTLATPRNINGVPFNGSEDILVTAAAGTLTGSTLNASVVNSSLTNVGTLTNLTVGSAHISTTNTLVAGLSAVAIATVNATYKSVQFVIQGIDSTNSKIHTVTIMAVSDGASVAKSVEFGSVNIGGETATFAVISASGQMSLIATPTSVSETTFKVIATTM